MTVADFVSAFPDQNDWVETFKSYALESVQHFMEELEFEEAPESLTLRLCINLEDEMTLYCPRWLWHNREALRSECHQFQRHHGFCSRTWGPFWRSSGCSGDQQPAPSPWSPWCTWRL